MRYWAVGDVFQATTKIEKGCQLLLGLEPFVDPIHHFGAELVYDTASFGHNLYCLRRAGSFI
jgi:hypothetical protein